MRYTLVAALGLPFVLAVPAMAQQSGQPQGSSGSKQQANAQSAENQNSPAIQQQVKKDLEQAGFKDVQIMPQSFLVHAHDKENRPVMMVINPDSLVAVTGMSNSATSSGSQSAGNASDKNDTTTR